MSQSPAPGIHVFVLRLWPETQNEGQTEWRGTVRHVASGESHTFADWPTLVNFIVTTLPALHSDDRARHES